MLTSSGQREEYSPLEADESRGLRRRAYWTPLVALCMACFGAVLFLTSQKPLLKQIQSNVCASALYDFETTFVMDKTYTDLSPLGNQAWDKLLPANGGYITKEIDGKSHKFGISMFHQLHCLQTLRAKIQMLANSSTNDNGPRDGHIGHCFDFLRQVDVALLPFPLSS